jgi:hypothetical protein
LTELDLEIKSGKLKPENFEAELRNRISSLLGQKQKEILSQIGEKFSNEPNVEKQANEYFQALNTKYDLNNNQGDNRYVKTVRAGLVDKVHINEFARASDKASRQIESAINAGKDKVVVSITSGQEPFALSPPFGNQNNPLVTQIEIDLKERGLNKGMTIKDKEVQNTLRDVMLIHGQGIEDRQKDYLSMKLTTAGSYEDPKSNFIGTEAYIKSRVNKTLTAREYTNLMYEFGSTGVGGKDTVVGELYSAKRTNFQPRGYEKKPEACHSIFKHSTNSKGIKNYSTTWKDKL